MKTRLTLDHDELSLLRVAVSLREESSFENMEDEPEEAERYKAWKRLGRKIGRARARLEGEAGDE